MNHSTTSSSLVFHMYRYTDCVCMYVFCNKQQSLLSFLLSLSSITNTYKTSHAAANTTEEHEKQKQNNIKEKIINFLYQFLYEFNFKKIMKYKSL